MPTDRPKRGRPAQGESAAVNTERVAILVPPEMKRYLENQPGNVGEYIRSLVEREMLRQRQQPADPDGVKGLMDYIKHNV